MQINNFGIFENKQVKEYVLKNGKIEAKILNYGGTIRSIKVPDALNNMIDVVLGYDTIEEYVNNDGYLGALIGRFGNRIEKGRFFLNGKEYQVGINDNGNSLHGGIKGFNAKIWDVEVVSESSIKLTYFSKDTEEGYPGNLTVNVLYSLSGFGLSIEYFATCDQDTIINLTNHAYFNLSGEGNGTILDTFIKIDADNITPVDEKLIPHNEILSVKNSPFDFTKFKAIGCDIENNDINLKNCGGYDTNFCLNKSGYRKVVDAFSPRTKISMEVYTDKQGVQFYVGNFLNNVKGKNGHIYDKREGFCLETQGYPNSVNCDKYPSPILKKGEKYYSKTEYKWGIVNE